MLYENSVHHSTRKFLSLVEIRTAVCKMFYVTVFSQTVKCKFRVNTSVR